MHLFIFACNLVILQLTYIGPETKSTEYFQETPDGIRFKFYTASGKGLLQRMLQKNKKKKTEKKNIFKYLDKTNNKYNTYSNNNIPRGQLL